jgi:ADP-heptose:LPS heptosyltransferase
MKILVVQMLRLGDILMSAPVISGLRKKFPGAEIHVLAFANFRSCENLFKDKIIWHWLNREELQQAIGDIDSSFFRAADILERQLQPLRATKFDRVYNLTQTKMSGWICHYLAGRQTVGLHFDTHGQARFGSSWFRYLNDHIAAGRDEVFHYLDLFRFGCEVENEKPVWNFRRQKMNVSPTILAQVTTSDAKKTYSLSQWRKALEGFLAVNPEHTLGILAAPAESESLTAAFADCPRTSVLTCSLPEALSLMDEAKLLVTGDTSLKHLACAADLPVLELSIGSSDYRKTGVYKNGSWILQGRTPCAPCPHSSPCTQKTHECALQVTPEILARAMQGLLTKDGTGDYGVGVQLVETCISQTGLWLTKDLNSGAGEPQLRHLIEKAAWKFTLQGEYKNPLATFGTESLEISRIVGSWKHPELRAHLNFLETETASNDANMTGLLQSMRRWLERPLDAQRKRDCLGEVEKYCEKQMQDGASILNWVNDLKWPRVGAKVQPLTGLRRLQNHFEDLSRRSHIKLKLIRSLKLQFAEKQ